MTPRSIYMLVCLLGASLLSPALGQVKVDRVEITGNERTRDWIFEREFLLLSPDSIIQTEASEYTLTLADRIRNTNLFNRVTIQLLQKEGNVLHIEVVEKWYSWPIPFVEFSDRNFNIWEDLDFGLDRTNYGLYLFNYNLFGSNHTAKLSMVHGYNRKRGIEYRIPALGKFSNTGIAFRLQHEEQDELWHTTASDRLGFYGGGDKRLVQHNWGSLGISHQLEAEISVGVNYALSRIRVAETARHNEYGIPFLEDGERTQLHHFLGTYLLRDFRNNRYFATKGHYHLLAAEAEFGDLNNFRMRIDHRSYGTFGGRHAYAFGGYLEHNSNPRRAYRNRRMLGYNRFVRGYENYVIDGQSAVLIKSAYRYHLIKREYPLDFVPYLNYKFLPIHSFLELYSDAGYVQSNQPGPLNRLPNSWMYSIGIGWNVLAYNDKVFRFEYSVNAMSESGWFVHFTQSI